MQNQFFNNVHKSFRIRALLARSKQVRFLNKTQQVFRRVLLPLNMYQVFMLFFLPLNMYQVLLLNIVGILALPLSQILARPLSQLRVLHKSP